MLLRLTNAYPGQLIYLVCNSRMYPIIGRIFGLLFLCLLDARPASLLSVPGLCNVPLTHRVVTYEVRPYNSARFG